MTEPVAPLTPTDCDLRDFAFMPLDVVRLRDSDLVALESAEAFRAAVMLWCASWHQLPAASLPDDDRVLANLAGYGRVVREWQKDRDGAMRGWIKCADGRLYHPVVAEKANEAWLGKLRRQWSTECARIKKHNERHGTSIEKPDFDSWIGAGRPQGQQLTVPSDKGIQSSGHIDECPDDKAGTRPSKGQQTVDSGQGQGQLMNPTGSTPDKPARGKRGSKRVPETFVVTDDLKAWAAANAPGVDWERETAKFRDWEFQHARTDWAATWRTWMRNARERIASSGRQQASGVDWTAGAH